MSFRTTTAAILTAAIIAAPVAASAQTVQTVTLLQEIVSLQQQLIAALQSEVAQLQGEVNSTASSSEALATTASPNDEAFSASPSSGSAPLSVMFTGAGLDAPGSSASYVVDFGDGSSGEASANGANYTVSHTYQSNGTFNATLYLEQNICGRASTLSGCVSDLQVGSSNVTVEPATIPIVAGTSTTPTPPTNNPDSVSYYCSAGGGPVPVTYFWSATPCTTVGSWETL